MASTNSEQVVEYLSQFTKWRPYEHRVLAKVRGQLVPIPINLDTVNRLYGLDLTSEELNAANDRIRVGDRSGIHRTLGVKRGGQKQCRQRQDKPKMQMNPG